MHYPEDTQDKRLAGKTFSYAVKVQSIKQKSLPELNDEFARQLGEFQTVDDVRKVIREQIESERKHQAEHDAKEKLVGELIQRNDFEVPDSLIEQQIDIRLERGLRALAAQGLTAEQMKNCLLYTSLHRILHGVEKARIDLRIETRILMQRGRQQKRPEKFAGRLSPHGGPESLGVRIPTLSEASWRVICLADRGTQHGPRDCVHGDTIVHEQLKFFSWRKPLRIQCDVGENDGLLL